MALTQLPKKKACYFQLTHEAKSGLDELARYYDTTLTNLIEEGARMVIRSRLKRINLESIEAQKLHSSLSY
jgi:hypothetical protein